MEYALHGNLKNFLRSLRPTLAPQTSHYTDPSYTTHSKLLRDYLILRDKRQSTIQYTEQSIERYQSIGRDQCKGDQCINRERHISSTVEPLGEEQQCIEDHLCWCEVTNTVECLYCRRNNDNLSSKGLYVNLSPHLEKEGNTALKQHMNEHERDPVTTERDNVILESANSDNNKGFVLTDKEIFNFALQISCGMEHLQKLKVSQTPPLFS